MTSISLNSHVPGKFRDDILKNLYWVDPGIRHLEFCDREQVLYLSYDGARDLGEVIQELSRQVESLLAVQLRIPSRVFFERERSGPMPGASEAKILQTLQDRGWLCQTCEGAWMLAGPLCALFKGLDSLFKSRATQLGASDLVLPTLMSYSHLHRSGYLQDFLHHVHLVSHLPEQMEVLERLKVSGQASEQVGKELLPPEYVLSPTVCHHLYCALAEQGLKSNLFAATAMCSCFRHEGRATRGLRRLREFRMREIIFLGQPVEVSTQRSRMLQLLQELLTLLDLQASLVTASDPFFADVYSKQRLFAVSFETKIEVKAYLPGDQDWFAIGSLNAPKDYLTKRFDIRTPDGQLAHSCCLAFGLDRFCLAVLAQCGIEPEDWPKPLQEEIARQ